MEKNDQKIFVFHGADHKVGTTMTAQAVAELISKERKELKVLFLCLNGRESTEYCREDTGTIESIKIRADNKMLTKDDILKVCAKQNNLYILGGVANLLNHRYYSAEFARDITELAATIFDIIIIDSGNDIDSGLAVGALKMSINRFMVISQHESIIKRYELLRNFYSEIGINFGKFLINRYTKDDPHDMHYIKKRLGIESSDIIYINDENMYSRFAEMDQNTLLEYKRQDYIYCIEIISAYILKIAGVSALICSQKKKKRKLWKNSI